MRRDYTFTSLSTSHARRHNCAQQPKLTLVASPIAAAVWLRRCTSLALYSKEPFNSCPLLDLTLWNRIVVGAVNGQLQLAFTKLSTLHSKNNFSLAIVTGNLFSEDDDTVSDLLANKIAIPLPTYFTIGTQALPARIVERIERDEEVSFSESLSVGSMLIGA